MVMQFAERANLIGSAINYTMLKAKWGTPSVDNTWQARLMRRENEPVSLTGDWIYTDRVHFYQLWANVKGKRVDSRPDQLDLMTDAYVDGNKVYVVLNNLAWEDQVVKLNMFENYGVDIEQLMVKHYQLDDRFAAFDQNSDRLDTTYYTGNNLPGFFTIGAEGTMILEYTFAESIEIDQTSNEVKYYATDYYQPIQANTPLVFEINDVQTNSNGEAVLRLGLGRDHGKSLTPVVLVNGTQVAVPVDYRGDEQVDRETFFGVIEIDVPNELLQTNNTISITFPDAGGHVSSLALQTFGFSGDVKRSPEDGSAESTLVFDNVAKYKSSEYDLGGTLDVTT